jgi:tight adherence protein C
MRLLLFFLMVVGPAFLSVREIARADRRALPLLFPVEAGFLVASLIVWDGLSRRLENRRISRRRALEFDEPPAREVAAGDPEERGPIGRWLALAGYRSPGAARIFVGLTAVMFVVGIAPILLLRRSRLLETGLRALERIPGAVGEIFWAPLVLGPWIILVILVCIPWLMVQRARRRLVSDVEQDLPLVLELLSTLGESGLGFDAALERVIDAQPPERPLTVEFRAFQREVLTGRSRIAALRRMAHRLDIPTMTIFVSALVQAEQIGSGVADVLRRQADDVRDRRRDRALNLAQALPVKLLFPLIICFLPAIFVVTLGPICLQFIKFADAIVNKGSPP